ncbi:Mpp10 protein [Polyplosphaeria fusca]|uniref:U3 small nucleolar ribonucleoprotein protein MPP10 n=1 Tax=Polyplosphaeria fusca TaxID=682080 RepID=A0A9P4RBS8_9PLEO|nr:Mpp10 protein [Polyplosphaeria fusca]
MAPLAISPDASISSHTLSAGSVQPPPMDLNNSSADALANLLKTPHMFLQPTPQVKSYFLSAAAQYLNPVAHGVSEQQTQRQQGLRRKRKRAGDAGVDIPVLHLKRLHLDGFGANQVFEQTRKIVNATADEIELTLSSADTNGVSIPVGSESEGQPEEDDELSDSSPGEEGVDWTYDQDDVSGDDLSEDEDDLQNGHTGEHDGQLQDEVEDEEAYSFSESEDNAATASWRPDKHGLNDSFFDIDDFNRSTLLMEEGNIVGESSSDDEDINLETDPFTAQADRFGGKARREEFSDDESEEDGPTFGNADLHAPESESDNDEALSDHDLDMGDGGNANDLMYADFFAPPPKKAGKNKKKRGRPNPHNFPTAAEPQEDDVEEDDVKRTMDAVHRDLFEDDDDAESPDDLSDVEEGPASRRSNYERRQAKLREEIRRLEAANVAKKAWQVSGEVTAKQRPINSLLEEGDLEFERAGKPVPVITAEVSEDIEAIIKRRILAGEFDENRRRRPDDLATGPVRRGQFELDDSKSKQGLAEIYEEEHLRRTDANFVDARDEKLKKEHAEIESLWKAVSRKLDSLSSWHYKPKPAAPNLEIRVDAPAIEMEDARPTAGGEVAGQSMLAPQELYKPGEDKKKAEIVTKGGMPVAREEMTRDEKKRRRMREKERIKKGNLNESSANVESKKAKDKKQLVGDLKKGGVQIIGKKGQLTDVEGKQIKDRVRTGGGNLKL